MVLQVMYPTKMVVDTDGREIPMNEFEQVLAEMKELHDRKRSDYGRKEDPFANVRASEDFGVEGWVGAMIRANDKMRRLQAAAKGSTLRNEGIEDSLIDMAIYSAIALTMYRESKRRDEIVEKALLSEAYKENSQGR